MAAVKLIARLGSDNITQHLKIATATETIETNTNLEAITGYWSEPVIKKR